MSGELDHLRFPTRETEAGLLGRVPGAPAAADSRPVRSSRRPPSTPAGGRRIEEVRLGPARPRRARPEAQGAEGSGTARPRPAGVRRACMPSPAAAGKRCPASPPAPGVPPGNPAAACGRSAWSPGPRSSGPRSRRRPRALARVALAQGLPRAPGDPSLTVRLSPAALPPQAARGVGGCGTPERNPKPRPGRCPGGGSGGKRRKVGKHTRVSTGLLSLCSKPLPSTCSGPWGARVCKCVSVSACVLGRIARRLSLPGAGLAMRGGRARRHPPQSLRFASSPSVASLANTNRRLNGGLCGRPSRPGAGR